MYQGGSSSSTSMAPWLYHSSSVVLPLRGLHASMTSNCYGKWPYHNDTRTNQYLVATGLEPIIYHKPIILAVQLLSMMH